MLDAPSLLPPYCIVCGKPATNAHHVIPGDRRNPRNPRLRLCGSGTTGCHGDAHRRTLHFRFAAGEWQYLRSPTAWKYTTALDSLGWKPV